MHTFLAQQPEAELALRRGARRQMAMIRGWLERGVDGFRLDVFNAFFKHAELSDNPAIRDLPTLAGPWRVLPPGPPVRQGALSFHGWLREFARRSISSRGA